MKSYFTNKLFFFFAIVAFPYFLSGQAIEKWWPHPIWGAGDQAGASNWITPDKIVKAMTLVKTGKTYELGNLYENGMPVSGNRNYKLMIPSFPTHGPNPSTNVVFNDEYITGELGQVGTQFDGLGHPGKLMKLENGKETEVFYNGYSKEDMRNPYGLLKLGIEHVKPIVTRGLLIDVAGYLNIKTVKDGYELNLNELKAILLKQGISESWIEPGDAILFNFGWYHKWPTDKTLMDGTKRPKINVDIIKWLTDKKPCMVGSDAILDGEIFNVHTELTMKQGIFNLEWMRFDTMTEDKSYQFLFIFTPLRLKGATGSPGRPIAIR